MTATKSGAAATRVLRSGAMIRQRCKLLVSTPQSPRFEPDGAIQHTSMGEGLMGQTGPRGTE
mgnify:CR=1 FL=1